MTGFGGMVCFDLDGEFNRAARLYDKLKVIKRAASLGASPRVSPEKRREKQEIAAWFRVWLETPDLFFDWLELRKHSEEFQRMFAEGGRSRAEERKQ